MRQLFFLMFLLPGFLEAQNTPNSGQLASLNKFIDGYNKQDFNQMRTPLAGVMKLALSKKNLKLIYGANYLMLGKAKIVNVKSNSEKQLSFDLVYEKDTTESHRMGFAFTRKNKIIGISSKSIKLKYPLTSDTPKLSESTVKFKIDSLLQLKYAANVFSGCVSVMNHGQVIYQNCVGYSNFDKQTLLNDSSMFDLASCSKQFTAMAILMLAEQGKLSLGDDLKKYLPALPYKNITLENLLNHTSGLPDYEEMLEAHWDKKKFATNQDIVDYFKKYNPKILFKPGTKYEYSNSGYAMLSLVIEQVSGLTYAEFLSKNIFKPLGMRHSRVYNSRRSAGEVIPNYAYGYVYSDSLKKRILPDSLPDYDYVIYMDAITGDGTVNSTVSDLILWENGLRTYKLVSKGTLDKAFTKGKLKSGAAIDYGYGWELFQEDKFQRVAYHSGSWPGYITFILHFIDSDQSIILLSNNEYIHTLEFVNKIALLITKT